MGARVDRVAAVVAHHPQSPLGHGDVEPQLARRVPGLHVRLLEGLAVDEQAPLVVAAGDAVPRQPHDALDVVGLPRAEAQHPRDTGADGGQALRVRRRVGEGAGAVEDDDVTALDVGGVDAPDEHALTRLQRRLHRVRGDGEGLHDEGADEQDQQEGDGEHEDGPRPARGAAPSRLTGRRRPRLGGRHGTPASRGLHAARARLGSLDGPAGNPSATTRAGPRRGPGSRWRCWTQPRGLVVSRRSLILAALPRRSRR